MNWVRILLLGVVAIGLSYGVGLSHTSGAAEPAEEAQRFPILTRFEVPRNYGYFIGDDIPLTLIVETSQGVILDLVNLPKKGEKHGLFEIRDVRLSTVPQAAGGTIYRAAYVLQYFGATPLTVLFEPLEILYARSVERSSASQTYSYQSLHTQPVSLNLARIGPYGPTNALDIKGPVTDSRDFLWWGSVSLGTLLLLCATGAGGRRWYLARAYHRACGGAALSPAASTLETLRQEEMACRPMTEAVWPGVERLQELIRHYLHATYTISAHTLTTTELGAFLHDKPCGKELLDLLERCDSVKYEPPLAAHTDERQLWWETISVFEKLQHTEVS
jgi:hypothetical protein